MSITIREKTSGATLASGDSPAEVVTYEGNWYFAPRPWRKTRSPSPPKTYTCPYKGTCHYVDYTGPDGSTARDVAWVYAEPKAGPRGHQGPIWILCRVARRDHAGLKAIFTAENAEIAESKREQMRSRTRSKFSRPFSLFSPRSLRSLR